MFLSQMMGVLDHFGKIRKRNQHGLLYLIISIKVCNEENVSCQHIVFTKSPWTSFLTNELTKIFSNYIVNRHTQ